MHRRRLRKACSIHQRCSTSTDCMLSHQVHYVRQLNIHQYFISSEIIYSVVIVTIKWSILAFYQRIFPHRWFQWALLGIAVFMGAWMFTTVFAISFQCIPIEFNWDTKIPGGHCINIGQLALVTSILNVLTDVAILILPLPLVWKLNVSRHRRWGLILLFGLGGGACIVGITRAGYIGNLNATTDPTCKLSLLPTLPARLLTLKKGTMYLRRTYPLSKFLQVSSSRVSPLIRYSSVAPWARPTPPSSLTLAAERRHPETQEEARIHASDPSCPGIGLPTSTKSSFLARHRRITAGNRFRRSPRAGFRITI